MSKHKLNRRDFIRTAGLSTAALILPFDKMLPEIKKKPKIGLQLYSIRREIKNDFIGSMKKVAVTGYLGIETYALPENLTVKKASAVFKELNLKVFSMHSDLPVGKVLEETVKNADIYGCDTVIYHGWPQDEKYKNKISLQKTAESYDKIAGMLKAEGLRFGLHNHWWEFEKNADGIYPFYYLFDNLSEDIIFEIDTYWAKTAGMDPAKVIKDFGSRAPLLHIKDGPAVKGKKGYEQVPAGSGTMDFNSIVKASRNNAEWMIIEFDEYGKNIFDGIRKSYNYIISNKFAVGKI